LLFLLSKKEQNKIQRKQRKKNRVEKQQQNPDAMLNKVSISKEYTLAELGVLAKVTTVD
jgi:hypothetical protein